MTVSLALVVGIVGIINTMLMSTTERFVEFGVLRTNGWSRGQYPDACDSGKRLSGAVGRARRLCAGRDRHVGGQSILSAAGIHLGVDPLASGAGHQAFGRSWALWAAFILPGERPGWFPWKPSGSDRIEAHADDRSGERLEILPQRRRMVEALRRALLPRSSGDGSRSSSGPAAQAKAPFLYLLGALDRPDAGEILVDGQSLATMSEATQNVYRREQVGFIFQSFNLISNLSALENVLVPFLPRGVTADQNSVPPSCSSRSVSEDRLDHRPYQLSGGEQQRVAIARALSSGRLLVLADEPTGELDSKTGDEIYTILRSMQHPSRRPWLS